MFLDQYNNILLLVRPQKISPSIPSPRDTVHFTTEQHVGMETGLGRFRIEGEAETLGAITPDSQWNPPETPTRTLNRHVGSTPTNGQPQPDKRPGDWPTWLAFQIQSADTAA